MGGGYSQEESFRMKIWMENKAKIEKHNRHFYKVLLVHWVVLGSSMYLYDRESTHTTFV